MIRALYKLAPGFFPYLQEFIPLCVLETLSFSFIAGMDRGTHAHNADYQHGAPFPASSVIGNDLPGLMKL